MGRGSGDWLFRRPGSRYRVSGRGGRQISRTLQLGQSPGGVVHLRHCQAEPVPQEPEPFGAGPGDRPLQLPPVDGISRGGGGARHGCRARCGRAAWVFIIWCIWCGMIPVHCERQGWDGDHRRCPCEDSVHCIAFLGRQYSRNCRMLMPELIWHGIISCPLSSVRFQNSFAPANAEFCTRGRYGQKRYRPGDLSECGHDSTAAVHSWKCAAGIKRMRDFAVPSVSPLGGRGRIERCGNTPGERAITRFAAQTRSRPPVNLQRPRTAGTKRDGTGPMSCAPKLVPPGSRPASNGYRSVRW